MGGELAGRATIIQPGRLLTPQQGRAARVTEHTTAIRLIDTADAVTLARHLENNAKAFSRWLPARPDGFYEQAHQVLRIENLLRTYEEGSGWPGVILSEGQVIGQVTVATILRGPLQKGFISYWVAQEFQKQGHAGRAVGQVLRVMRDDLGLRRAEAHTQMDNTASHAVLRNNGFTPWGIAHAHILVNGEWRDEIFWERPLVH